MKTITLSDLSSGDISVAAETIISGIKAYNGKLDTRKGTVLRDLLVDPDAAMEGLMSRQIAEVRNSTSLKVMQEAQSNGDEVDDADVSAVLSNFNMESGRGTKSSGIVKITVSDPGISYSVRQGAVFRTVDGIEFESTELVIASSDEISNPSVRATTKLYKGVAGWFFLVPVAAVEVGANGNIQQGTALEADSPSFTYVSSEAYKDFDGGLDAMPLDKTIDSIPANLSIRGFVSKTSIEGMLRSKFDGGDFPIIAVSSVGYGNGAQRRDKHNVMGVAVGGRVDVYIRNFGDLFTVTKTLTGTLDGTVYRISVPKGVFPGACWIKSVEDMEAQGSSGSSDADDREEVLGSLEFTAKRTSDIGDTWHDIVVDGDNPSEAFNTVWQGFDISLTDTPPNVEPVQDGEEWAWSQDREFKVTAYCMPQADDIQAYFDDDTIRSISSDVVARCPIICRVTVSATVRYDVANPMDENYAKSKIREYINGLGFVGRLTRSEIVYVLKSCGAIAVDMPEKNMLYGIMHDAFGNEVRIQGDALDISSVIDYKAMVSPDTVVFAAERDDIQLVMIPGSRQ